jgi:hypothetical protein
VLLAPRGIFYIQGWRKGSEHASLGDARLQALTFVT